MSGCEDEEEIAELLRKLIELQEDANSWANASAGEWEEVKVREATLRAQLIEKLACSRHYGIDVGDVLTARYVDLARPPWTHDLPARVASLWAQQCGVQGASATAAAEVLGQVDCHPRLCQQELCWHCWHLEECGCRPSELDELLGHTKEAAWAASPSHRARLVEQRWHFFDMLAEATRRAVSGKAASMEGKPSVLVLGGLGVAAVQAALAGASVQLVEGNEYVAGTMRESMKINGVESAVALVHNLAAVEGAPDIIVLEGFEPDGLLGCGVLAQWQSLLASSSVKEDSVVLPSALKFSAVLAECRLRTAAGTDLDLGEFAKSYGGLSPLPRMAAGTSATALPIKQLGPQLDFLELNLALPLGNLSSGSQDISLACLDTSPALADAVLLHCFARFDLPGEHGSYSQIAECLHPFASPLSVLAETPVDVKAAWNTHRFWFHPLDIARYSVAPFPRVQLLDWYSDMMNDEPRNRAFLAGLREAVGSFRTAEETSCRVVDLGCGVGVLSCMAVLAGASAVQGIEIAPHLARCAERVLARNNKTGTKVEMQCSDLRAVACEDRESRFDVVVAELLDAGGLGERLVPFMRHAKAHLLQENGKVVPSSMRVHAVLASISLPAAGGVDCSAFTPFWLQAQASAGEWLALDLDAGAAWHACSEAVELYSLNFQGSQQEIVAALQEKEVVFPVLPAPEAAQQTCNALVWWFEAQLSPTCPPLSSGPRSLRPPGSEATHWAQAVAHVGPWQLDANASSIHVQLRTDGTHLTWTPLGMKLRTLPSLMPFATQDDHPLASSAHACKMRSRDALDAIRALRRTLDQVGDIARLHAVQSAVLHIAAQPLLFGIEAVSEAVVPVLKDFYM